MDRHCLWARDAGFHFPQCQHGAEIHAFMGEKWPWRLCYERCRLLFYSVFGRRRAALEPALRAQVASAPAQTLRELCQWVRATHNIEVGTTTMHKTLGRFGLTLKKNNPARRRAGAARCGSGAHALEG